jgi:hypothetical protein
MDFKLCMNLGTLNHRKVVSLNSGGKIWKK